MSEAMSSVEIEDVLSSIRRLVSEDLRPTARTVAAKKPDEKLILTPAFRVVADSSPDLPPAAIAKPAVAKLPLPRLHLGAEPVIEELVANLERAVEAQDVEWESEVGDPAPMVSDMEWTETGWVALDSVLRDDEVPTDLLDESLQQDIRRDAATPSWAQDDPDQAADYAEAVLTPEPPIAEPDEYWADKAEAEAVAELRGTTTTEEASLFVGGGAEVSFDEEVLRDLVRDLIREELQGGLGERITRNVRKLVRAEIARALAAQDLE